MLVKVLGTRDLDFKATNGNEIKGKQILLSFYQDGVSGEMDDKLFAITVYVQECKKNILYGY